MASCARVSACPFRCICGIAITTCSLTQWANPSRRTYGRPLKGYAFVDNSNRSRPIDDCHPDVQKAHLSARWKGGLDVGDQVTIDGVTRVGANYNDDSEVEFYSIADGDALKKHAYDQSKKNLSGRWKTKPKKEQREPDEREWECAGPLSDSQSAELKEQAWRDSVEELQNAWRK